MSQLMLSLSEETPEQRDEFLKAWEEKKEKHLREVIAEWTAVSNLAQRRGYTSLNDDEFVNCSFDKLTRNPDNSEAIDIFQRWTPETKVGIFLWGGVGAGKSMLCKALIIKWARPEFRCKFIFVGDALQLLHDAMDSEHMTVGTAIASLILPHLLVIDDIGCEKSSDWRNEKIFSLFESRAKEGKFTFFTSNLNADEFKSKYGFRIHDRTIQYCRWLNLKGDSFRKAQYPRSFSW